MSSRQDFFWFNWFISWYTSLCVFRVFAIVRNNTMEVISNSICLVGDRNWDPSQTPNPTLGRWLNSWKYLGRISTVAPFAWTPATRNVRTTQQSPSSLWSPSSTRSELSTSRTPRTPTPTACWASCETPTQEIGHNSQKGTVSVALAIINALKLVRKTVNEVMFVFLSGGASNTTYNDSHKFIVFGTKGELHKNRVSGKEDTTNWRGANTQNLWVHQQDQERRCDAGALVTPPFPCGKVWVGQEDRKTNPFQETYPSMAKEVGTFPPVLCASPESWRACSSCVASASRTAWTPQPRTLPPSMIKSTALTQIGFIPHRFCLYRDEDN